MALWRNRMTVKHKNQMDNEPVEKFEGMAEKSMAEKKKK